MLEELPEELPRDNRLNHIRPIETINTVGPDDTSLVGEQFSFTLLIVKPNLTETAFYAIVNYPKC
jgi:hypothetical protein